MAAQQLSSSIDTPSELSVNKELKSTDNSDIDSCVHRSLSSKPNISSMTSALSTNTTVSSTSSESSLTVYCIETGSIAQSIRRRQSLTNPNVPTNTIGVTTTSVDEGRLLNDKDKLPERLLDVEKTITITDGDNDSLDNDNYDGDDDDDDDNNNDDDDVGEDHAIIDDSIYPHSFPTPPNYVRSPCPICFEQAVLQVSPCCYYLCCNSCWRAHISATINSGRIKIPCVSNECNKFLTRESIVNFVRYDPSLHERYLKLYINSNTNPRAKTCPRCCHLYSLDTIMTIPIVKKKTWKSDNTKKIPKQVQCPECSLIWCFRCSAPWHENMTCKQFNKGDKLLLKWINRKDDEQWNARKCPKCSSLIQRAGGCPHMTCQACSCEFCYLCGRRYFQIPLIGQHSNRWSVFGCPYNFYPEKPWLRRTVRGMVATGFVAVSPLIAVGIITAAVTVLPSFGIYKLVSHARARRRARAAANFPIGEPFLVEPDFDHPIAVQESFLRSPVYDDIDSVDMMHILGPAREILTSSTLHNFNESSNNEIEMIFPLSIFAEMDIENLTSDVNDKDYSQISHLDFRTCPTTPASTIRKGLSRSLSNITTICHPSLRRRQSLTKEQ